MVSTRNNPVIFNLGEITNEEVCKGVGRRGSNVCVARVCEQCAGGGRESTAGETFQGDDCRHLEVKKDNDGNIIEVTLKHKEATYQITLDGKGKELAKAMEGKKVKVVGIVETKGGVKWLTVEEFSEPPAKPEGKHPHQKSKNKE